MVMDGVNTDPASSSVLGTNRAVIDHNHPLFLHPNDTPGSSLVSLQLTGSANYALWSRSMKLGLLGKSKLEFVDGRHTKDKFDASLHDQWEKVNAVVLSWIMNAVKSDLLSSSIYASNAHKVWLDLQERFDTINGSRIFYLHREIVTLTQGTQSVSDYFSKMRTLWDEFDALMPCPGCNCPESRNYSQHSGYQRLLQFLMGLNETYAQCRSQLLMMSPLPTLNKAYSLVISQESQRSIASLSPVSQVAESIEGAGFFSHKGGTRVNNGRNNYSGGNMNSGRNFSGGGSSSGGNYSGRVPPASGVRPPKKSSIICEYCNYNGHTKEQCYKLIGYPPEWPSSKKKGVFANQVGSYGNSESGVNCSNDSETAAQCNLGTTQSSASSHGSLPPYFTQEQYTQIIQMLSKGNGETVPTQTANAGSLHWHGEGDW